MSRFLNGLNKDIAMTVELQNYTSWQELVHLAAKIEGQRKTRYISSKPNASSSWSRSSRVYDSKSKTVAPSEVAKGESNKSKDAFVKPRNDTTKLHEKVDTPRPRTRDLECWKCHGKGHTMKDCPNKRALVLRNGELVSDDEEEVQECTVGSDLDSDEEDPHTYSLVSRRALSTNVKIEDDNNQRENLFHSRCLIQNIPCSLVIDNGSCTNVVSDALVAKLNLTTMPHPKPYKLQWLNDSNEIKVSLQSLFTFTIGKYVDDVLCDVAPMHVGDLLLGRPWHFDKDVLYHGRTNKYTLQHNDRKVSLIPLHPKEVLNDQHKLEMRRRDLAKAKEYEKRKGKDKAPIVDSSLKPKVNMFLARSHEVMQASKSTCLLFVVKGPCIWTLEVYNDFSS